MIDLRTAAQAALEAIEDFNVQCRGRQIFLPAEIDTAIDALRTALAADKAPADDGLLHDSVHVDSGKVRAAQSVRTEMSYRPGSLPMDAPGLIPLHPTQWVICPRCKGISPMRPAEQTAPPLRDLSDEEIDKAWRSATIDYTAPYDNFKREVARAIIAAARGKK